MKSFVSLFCIVLIFIFAPGCAGSKDGGGSPRIINTKPGRGEIAVVGDSLAYGTGAKDIFNTPTGCLTRAFAPSVVLNRAEPGATTGEILAHALKYLSPAPKLVFISAGGNDAVMDFYNPGSYPVDQSLQELKQLIKEYQDVGTLVAYLSLNPPYDKTASERLQKISSEAANMGVIIVNGMQGLWNTDKMSDQFHPNDEGYQIMCKKMIQAISPHYP